VRAVVEGKDAMSNSVGGAFVTQFPSDGALGLSLTSIQGGTGAAANATAILATSTANASSPFSLLASSSATTTSSPTIAALTTGELSNEDHTVIAQIGETPGNSLLIPWNANGTAPSVVANLQGLGWIKLGQVQTTPGVSVPTGANYSLTPVGQAIFKRTVSSTLGPGTQDSVANATAPASSTSSESAATAEAGLSSEVSTLLSTLSSLGVNVQV
jgi:hypothetical protein